MYFNLKSLKILTAKWLNHQIIIDFSRINGLKELVIDWHKEQENLFNLKELQSLRLWNYKSKKFNLEEFRNLTALNFLDINFFISKKIEQVLENKNICHNLNYFEELVNKRVKNYIEDIIIEGHYHQAKSYKIGNQEYINIPSLCCQKSFTRFKNKTFLNENL